MKDVPPLKNEVYSPGVLDKAVWLDISSVSDWDRIIEWYSDLSEYPSREDTRVRAKALELTAEAGSDAEKARILYDFVANQVIYESMLFQYSGQIPEPAPRILRSRQGDCKDKVCLLRSMLRSIGVESYFALVSPVTYGITPVLPSPRFNHAIMAIPEGDTYRFLDPTAKGMSSRRLPSNLRGANALVIKPDSVGLTKIPMEAASDEYTSIDTEIKVDPSGSYRLKRTECIRIGSAVTQLVNDLADSDAEGRTEYLEIQLGSSLVGFDVVSDEWAGLETGSDSVRVEYELQIENAVTQGNMKLASIPWDSSVGPLFGTLVASLERDEPLALYGLKINETENIRIEFPPGWRVASLPESRRFDCEFGEGAFHYEMKGNAVSARRSVAINGLLVHPDEYEAFRGFLVGIIREQSDNRIVLR
jgi:hypothetical protein